MKSRTLVFASALAATLSFFACDDKGSSGTAATGSAPVAVSASPSIAAVMSAAPSAMPAMTAAGSASAAAVASASAAPTTSASVGATAAATDAGSAGFACGAKTNPCPLQSWMQKNANPAVSSGDAAQVGTVLEQIAKFAPAGYGNWAKIANDGAAAGKSGDLSAAKAACRGCHDQYKQKYKTEMRDRKI